MNSPHTPESNDGSSTGSINGTGALESQQHRSLIHSHGDDDTDTKGSVQRPNHRRFMEQWGKEPRQIQERERAYTEIPLSPIGNDLGEFPATNGSRQFVTMTGTIKRGQKSGELVQVQLNEEEAMKLKKVSDVPDDKTGDCIWGLRKGIHIVLFTILCIPVALLVSLLVSFYIGTMCWYNIYLYLSEERTMWHKVFFCPLLILFYPFLIVVTAVGVSLYASVIQVSWYFSSWLKEFRDFEKGFFGWVCHKLGVSQCAPYEVVILNEDPNEGATTLEVQHSTV